MTIMISGTQGMPSILLATPNAVSNPFPFVGISDSDPNATVSATFELAPGNSTGPEPGGVPFGALTGTGIQTSAAGRYVRFLTNSVSPNELTQILENAIYTPGELNDNLRISALIMDSDGATANLEDRVVSGHFVPGGITISGPPNEGSMVNGSTTHPLSGMSVVDSNAVPGVTETAVVRVAYGDAELGAGGVSTQIASFSADSSSALTNDLHNLVYTAPNPENAPITQFSVTVTDNVVGVAGETPDGETYLFNDTNVAPNPPPPPGGPAPPPSPPPVTEATQAYQNILQRSPDPGGLQFWTNGITSGALTPAAVDSAITTSSEAQTWVDPIVRMYTVLGRAPDQQGLAGWVHAYEAGDPMSAIGMAFISSPEAQSKGLYGNTIPTAATSTAINTSVVDELYQQVLGRAADPGGQAFWVAMLQTGTMSIGTVVSAIVNSPEAINRDAGPVTNFLMAAGNGDAPYGGNLFAHS
jgi:Domain of unknown function (DUF4214)